MKSYINTLVFFGVSSNILYWQTWWATSLYSTPLCMQFCCRLVGIFFFRTTRCQCRHINNTHKWDPNVQVKFPQRFKALPNDFEDASSDCCFIILSLGCVKVTVH